MMESEPDSLQRAASLDSSVGEARYGLALNPAHACREIEGFLVSEMRRLRRRGVVLGLSGGLDSSVCAHLCTRALGRARVQTFILPERDTDPENMRDAELVAATLGLSPERIEIAPILDALGVYRLFTAEQAANRGVIENGLRWIRRLTGRPSPFSEALAILYESNGGWRERLGRRFLWRPLGRIHAFALAKVRIRMVLLHHHALLNNSLVVGTTDKSEWSIGFYDKYGDAACDIMLLRHLYKSQIRELARHLGLPPRLISKPSSGDLAAGLPNEAAIGLTYDQLDCILWGIEHRLPDEGIAAEASASLRAIAAVRRAIGAAAVRGLLPAHL